MPPKPPPPKRKQQAPEVRKPVQIDTTRPPARSVFPHTSEILDRIPPSDIEAEKNVLGSLLLSPGMIDDVAAVLEPADFYGDANACIYRHLLAMSAAGSKIDVVLLADRLQRASDWERVGEAAYIGEVVNSVAVASHAVHYAKIVVRTSRLRQAIHASTEILRRAYEPGVDPDDILGLAEGAFSKIKSGAYDRDPVSMEQAMIEALLQVDGIIEGTYVPGVHIGLHSFDDQVGGVFNGELTVIGARPSQGKTSLGLQMAGHCADSGLKVYFACLEMPAVDMGMKDLCRRSGVSQHRVRTGRIGPEDQRRLAEAGNSPSHKNIRLHDWASIRPFDIERAARRFGANIVFVDYLQIVTASDPKKNRNEQVGEITKALKEMARRMKVPVVVMAQIGRKAEEGKDPRPAMHHLRESGNIEQDCDMVCLLWRPEGGIHGAKGTAYDGDRWDAELDVAKVRLGAKARLRLDWDGERTLFTDHMTEQKEAF